MRKLFAVTIRQEGTWFVSRCLENGIASQGKTIDEAVENLREALILYYEDEAIPDTSQTYMTTLEVAL